jgi:hypothetical protein
MQDDLTIQYTLNASLVNALCELLLLDRSDENGWA